MMTISRLIRSALRAVAASTALAVLFSLAACGGSGSGPSSAPTGFKITVGDSAAVVSWDQQSGLQYWLFYAAAQVVTPSTYISYPGAKALFPANSPQVVTGLTNGTTYAFTLNATENGSKAGPATTSIAVTPGMRGSAWTTNAAMNAINMAGVAYGAGYYVAVGAGGTIDVSTDGATWTAVTSNTSSDLNAVVFDSVNTRFVAVGANGTMLTSTTGTSWSVASSGVTVKLTGVTYGNSAYVAVGTAGTILTSSDGSSWTSRTSGTANDLAGVAYANGLYIATGASGTLLTSSDAVNWTTRTSGTSSTLYAAAYGLPTSGTSTYVVVGAGGTVLSSSDAATWTVETKPSTQDLHAVVYGSQFIIAGYGSVLLYGTDGTNWTPAQVSAAPGDLNALVFGGGNYLAVGQAGANAITH